MCKLIKSISCMLVLLLALSCSAGICSASEATYQITETELTQLQNNLTKLENNYKILLQDSNTSSKQLIEALDQLTELKQLLEKCKLELTTTQQSLTKAQNSLTTANELFQQYAKEEKAKQTRLRIERDLSILAAIYFAVTK